MHITSFKCGYFIFCSTVFVNILQNFTQARFHQPGCLFCDFAFLTYVGTSNYSCAPKIVPTRSNQAKPWSSQTAFQDLLAFLEIPTINSKRGQNSESASSYAMRLQVFVTSNLSSLGQNILLILSYLTSNQLLRST